VRARVMREYAQKYQDNPNKQTHWLLDIS
jgi:hypothetical protein